jgi:hypothetical protein
VAGTLILLAVNTTIFGSHLKMDFVTDKNQYLLQAALAVAAIIAIRKLLSLGSKG